MNFEKDECGYVIPKFHRHNPCPLCAEGFHTKEQHKKDYFREYHYRRNKDNVGYRRGIHTSSFQQYFQMKEQNKV